MYMQSNRFVVASVLQDWSQGILFVYFGALDFTQHYQI